MKIIFLLNKNNVSADGVYSKKKSFSEKVKNASLRDIPRYANDILISRIKRKIGKKVQHQFGDPEISKDIDYVRLDTDLINTNKVEENLRSHNPDIIIHVSSNILKEQIYSIPTIGTLNLHHGVLPHIRGLDSMYWGIYYGEPNWVGATVHFIDDGIDTGDIVLKQSFDYVKEQRLSDIIVAIEKLGTELLISTINLLFDQNVIQKSRGGEISVKEKTRYRSKAHLGIILMVIIKIFVNKLRIKR
jgi:methionyl-tRNA formyltransferase